ncbi:MAG: Ig-like domain repeat protein, partial [Burkholderiaceae bacterium]
DEGESDLDLEWSGAVAPAATIKFIVSANTMTSDGIDLSAQYAVNNNVADIVSLSYGQCEASMGSTAVTFYGNLWQQAVAQGMTVLVSAGDSGAAGCDSSSASRATHGKGVNGLCTSPYSTCVGGTQFADTANPSLYWSSTTNSTDQSSVLSYIPEVVWNESGTNGGTGLWSTGGGKSIHFAKPSWQNITGVPNDGQRDVPDVSLSAASHDGYLAYSSDNTSSTQQLVAFGGTSASAPSFAGIVALIDQKTGYRQGNANVTLYGLASNQASGGPQTYFHLITSGNNSVPGVAGFSANSSTPYFNLATGLGSVDGNVLVSHWTDLLPVTSVALAASPNPSLIGQSVTFTATVSGSAPSGTVQFMDGATSMGAPVMLNSGTAALSVSSLSAGGHNITAAYSGDINNASSTSPVVTQTVATQIATTTSLSSSASSITAGQAVTLTATVTGSSPTGTVQFKDDGVALGPMINLNNGTAALNTNGLATAGNHSITADYSGNANNAASTSNMVNVTVTQAVSTVSISSSSSTSSQGQQVMFTATVSGVSPTGTVQFMDGGINLKNAVTLNNGVAKLIISTLAQGTHSITAVYSGDDNNAGSTSAAITQTVNAAVSADIPTLPEWAEIIFAMLLILIMITGNVHNTSLHLRKDK